MEERGTPVPGSRTPAEVRAARRRAALTALVFIVALYCFLVSIALITDGFKKVDAAYVDSVTGECGLSVALVRSAGNAFVGLFIGILVTSIVQSSSATTSTVVGLVAAGVLDLRCAIPIVMGANIGTTVTNTLVAMGHITRREELKRAFAGATMHDFFNVLTVAILLPVELATRALSSDGVGILQRVAAWLAGSMGGLRGHKGHGPLKVVLSPLTKPIVELFGGEAGSVAWGVALAVFALVVLFVSLYFMVRAMKVLFVGRAEQFLDRTVGRAPVLGLLVGTIVTATVQSSSVVTSMLVPLAASGVLTPTQVFPITLGANIGTTVTGILAALAVGGDGVTIALVHTLFNVTGVLIFFPAPFMRRIPVRLAGLLAGACARSRKWAFIYVLGAFFVVPIALIVVFELVT
jgi:sodium-dependent phosphate cotransporter